MTHVTCRLTAKNRDQLRNATLGNRVWATFAFYCCLLLRHQLRLEDVVQHVDQISIIIFSYIVWWTINGVYLINTCGNSGISGTFFVCLRS